jgi:hypothetical protein
MTVGELLEQLSTLPKDLPVEMDAGIPRAVSVLPSYYDGNCHKMDKSGNFVISNVGSKVIIEGMTLEDHIWRITEDSEFSVYDGLPFEKVMETILFEGLGDISIEHTIEKCKQYYNSSTSCYKEILDDILNGIILQISEPKNKIIESDSGIYLVGEKSDKKLTPYEEFVVRKSGRFTKRGIEWMYDGQ